jgi:phosphoglycolate phosphatase
MVFGHRTNFPTKPNPETVFEVLREFNVSKEESIFIGDSNVDIRTAKNAGVKSVGVSWGFRGEEELKAEGADFIASTVDELEKILI